MVAEVRPFQLHLDIVTGMLACQPSMMVKMFFTDASHLSLQQYLEPRSFGKC